MREKISQNAMKRILFVIFASTNYYNDYMLINFSFGNFRSFRDIKSLRMEAGRVEDLPDSVIEKDGFRLLPVAAIYGANSSGKTNVMNAFVFFRYIIRINLSLFSNNPLFQVPFMLDTQTKDAPTAFEIQFLLDNAVYKYGFEYLPTEIVSEWLYEKKVEPNSKEHVLFKRQGEKFIISTTYFPEGRNKKKFITKNHLFLSLVAQLNGKLSDKLITYINQCCTISGLGEEGYKLFSLKMFANKFDGYVQATNLFKKLDLGFTELEVEEFKISDETKEKIATLQDVNLKKTLESREYDIYTTHHVYDKEGKVVGQTRFNAESFESNGTLKIIGLSGLLFHTLLHGRVLFVDELDAKLHPMLTRAIVRLFMDEETNPKGAQLVFTTHDTHLLDKDYLRRDQVWFTEKDATEASDLYSLLEFKERNDRNFEKNYIEGRYGAIPFIR